MDSGKQININNPHNKQLVVSLNHEHMEEISCELLASEGLVFGREDVDEKGQLT